MSSYIVSKNVFGSSNIDLNIKSIQTTYAEDGSPIVYRTYQNGDKVVFNNSGEQIAYEPGNYINSANNPATINTNPANARDLAAAGAAIPQNGRSRWWQKWRARWKTTRNNVLPPNPRIQTCFRVQFQMQ